MCKERLAEQVRPTAAMHRESRLGGPTWYEIGPQSVPNSFPGGVREGPGRVLGRPRMGPERIFEPRGNLGALVGPFWGPLGSLLGDFGPVVGRY